MHWFTKDWWQYLLIKNKDTSRLTTFICRIKGHPYGVIWYNANGLEPDMHCKNCYDDLG